MFPYQSRYLGYEEIPQHILRAVRLGEVPGRDLFEEMNDDIPQVLDAVPH